jgi:hypothetical protein
LLQDYQVALHFNIVNACYIRHDIRKYTPSICVPPDNENMFFIQAVFLVGDLVIRAVHYSELLKLRKLYLVCKYF